MDKWTIEKLNNLSDSDSGSLQKDYIGIVLLQYPSDIKGFRLYKIFEIEELYAIQLSSLPSTPLMPLSIEEILKILNDIEIGANYALRQFNMRKENEEK